MCIRDRFADALALLKTLGGGKNRNDLTPEDEVLLCEYYREKGLGEFVFVYGTSCHTAIHCKVLSVTIR